MKNQVVYPAMESANVFCVLCENIRQSICESKCMKALLQFCSMLLEEEVTFGKLMSLLHAHVSFVALVLFGGATIWMCLLLMAWFLLSVYQCWRNW